MANNSDDLYDLSDLDIFYYYYICQKEEKLIPSISEETKNLLDYFKIKENKKYIFLQYVIKRKKENKSA